MLGREPTRKQVREYKCHHHALKEQILKLSQLRPAVTITWPGSYELYTVSLLHALCVHGEYQLYQHAGMA